jgi:hypothetical protein
VDYARALSGIAGGRVVALAPTGEIAGARGSLVIPSNGAAPYLVLDLVLTAPVTIGDGVAVTLEPSCGLDRVTGAPVLAGRT